MPYSALGVSLYQRKGQQVTPEWGLSLRGRGGHWVPCQVRGRGQDTRRATSANRSRPLI